MPKYICKKCNKEFNRKSAYDSHIMRIISCVKDTNINNECSYCKKTFYSKYKLNTHLNICKKKKSYDITQSQIEELKKIFERKFEEQQRKYEELEKKLELSDSKETNQNILVNENSHNTTTTTTTTNSNNNITTNNIQIYNVGKEDLSIIAKEDVVKICTSGTYYPIVAAQILHCNEKYPEFQNFLIPNLRSNTGLVKINDNWVSKSHDEIFRTLLKVDKSHVSSLMKDLEVDKKLQIKLESTQDEIDLGESKEHQIPKIKENLYNASRMIKRNKLKEEKVLLKN
jgi:hypothetical protein